jgi:hypothetical protein
MYLIGTSNFLEGVCVIVSVRTDMSGHPTHTVHSDMSCQSGKRFDAELTLRSSTISYNYRVKNDPKPALTVQCANTARANLLKYLGF